MVQAVPDPETGSWNFKQNPQIVWLMQSLSPEIIRCPKPGKDPKISGLKDNKNPQEPKISCDGKKRTLFGYSISWTEQRTVSRKLSAQGCYRSSQLLSQNRVKALSAPVQGNCSRCDQTTEIKEFQYQPTGQLSWNRGADGGRFTSSQKFPISRNRLL